MRRKIICAVVVIALIVAAVLVLPGGLDRLQGGEIPPSPLVAPESTLTEAEIAIPVADIDPAWNASAATKFTLAGDRVSVQGGGGFSLSEDHRVITIRQNGTYVFSGQWQDGQIVVDVADGRVHLVLAGADIFCAQSAPIYVKQASAVRIVAEAGTYNRLSDSTDYIYDDPVYMEPDATIFSADDLILCGTGELEVVGSFRDAIHTKDRLTVADLSLTVSAKEDGLIGHDALLLHSGTLRANCGRDCLKSNNPEPGFGYVYAAGGTYDLTAGTDAIQAERRLLITGGTYHMLCGGGYVYPAELESRKGIKAIDELVITGGSFDINSSDDALHADKRMSLRGGSYTLYAGDDAILATELYVGGGDVTVLTCLEGMVAEVMDIADGSISITSQMDGVNARIRAVLPDNGFDLYPEGTVETPSAAQLRISGGRLVVNADRDAVCVRGTMEMVGGMLLLAGPEFTGGDPLDCDIGFTMTGGTLVAVGRSVYMPALAGGSTVSIVEATFSAPREVDTSIAIRQGNQSLFTACAPRSYYKLVVFSDQLEEGQTYSLRLGGEMLTEDGRIVEGEGAIGDRAVANFVVHDGHAVLTEGGKLFPDQYFDEEIQ